ncbi:hypothetical protein BJX96DRAFT_117808 [Aspergillus floccosus]
MVLGGLHMASCANPSLARAAVCTKTIVVTGDGVGALAAAAKPCRRIWLPLSCPRILHDWCVGFKFGHQCRNIIRSLALLPRYRIRGWIRGWIWGRSLMSLQHDTPILLPFWQDKDQHS